MADRFFHFLCPDSHSVWNGNQFSKCFIDMTLDFGVNVLTIIITAVLGLTLKNSGRSRMKSLLGKFFLHFLPAIGLCLSLFDVIFLLRKSLNGDIVTYHEWFSTCSQFAVWTSTTILANCSNFEHIFSNQMLCFWWIVRAVFGTIILLKTYADIEILRTLNKSIFVLLDVMFGTTTFIIGSKKTISNISQMEDSLLSAELDLEENHLRNNKEYKQSCWNLLTFNSITSVMDDGIKKQLNFEDLLQLPTDMEPSFCHYKLSICWMNQYSENRSSTASLFRAICCAYGWPYVYLGLLKVLNDCFSFVGPMLLNRLIHFLQQDHF